MKAKYIRVSTEDQNHERQIDPSIKCYIDHGISGTMKFENRPEGKKLHKAILSGKVDYVVVQAIDRLSRNVREAQSIINFFIDNGCQLEILNPSLKVFNETTGEVDLITKMIMDLLGSLSEMEYRNIKERQTQGIAIAKLNGKYQGGKGGRKMSVEKSLIKHKDIVTGFKAKLSMRQCHILTGKSNVAIKRIYNLLDQKQM